MPLVTYKGNVSSYDGTGAIRLASTEEGVERVLHLNGPAMEVSDKELASLRSSFLLDEVEAEKKSEEEGAASDENADAKDKAGEKSQPASSSSVPAAAPASDVTSVSVGSDPSKSTPPTPRAGN